jgi:hypothetical protein
MSYGFRLTVKPNGKVRGNGGWQRALAHPRLCAYLRKPSPYPRMFTNNQKISFGIRDFFALFADFFLHQSANSADFRDFLF